LLDLDDIEAQIRLSIHQLFSTLEHRYQSGTSIFNLRILEGFWTSLFKKQTVE